MFAVSVAAASTDMDTLRFSLYSSASAVMYRASIWRSPTRPAVVSPRLSSIRNTFFVRLCAIIVPAVARRSAARMTPSLQTRPTVVVPVSTSLGTATIRTTPFEKSRKWTSEAYGRHYISLGPRVSGPGRTSARRSERQTRGVGDDLRGGDVDEPDEVRRAGRCPAEHETVSRAEVAQGRGILEREGEVVPGLRELEGGLRRDDDGHGLLEETDVVAREVDLLGHRGDADGPARGRVDDPRGQGEGGLRRGGRGPRAHGLGTRVPRDIHGVGPVLEE